jgi:RHH-type transcriptional regulator, rel operon repressor / antitoxin RelB
MIALDLPPELEQRLDALGKATGRGKTAIAEEAIAEYLGDLEDFYLAETKSRDIREGRSQTKPLADVMRKYGLDN